ncbi:hypothetical protein BURKHO8Y_270020 [Burkholderia sp. 8Y]|nr:hypothetical protein BURKHO8Y_270020 [Burkholderia sp. 8Y]
MAPTTRCRSVPTCTPKACTSMQTARNAVPTAAHLPLKLRSPTWATRLVATTKKLRLSAFVTSSKNCGSASQSPDAIGLRAFLLYGHIAQTGFYPRDVCRQRPAHGKELIRDLPTTAHAKILIHQQTSSEVAGAVVPAAFVGLLLCGSY